MKKTEEVYYFEQSVPVPSYLIAIAVGRIVSRQIGPRSTIWAEPEVIDAAAYEFSDVETYLQEVESLLGPYVWGKYDILILPPSFPCNGMENTCLTFLTPSLLAGDKSLVSVAIHEIIHSWSGNLVTNLNWEHFWLNEGFTKFIERKVIGRLRGEPVRELLAHVGYAELKDNIRLVGETSHLTSLSPRLKGLSPNDAYTRVPYEKGHAFLYHLEKIVGGPQNFDPYLHAHIQHFASQSITTAQWKEFLLNYFDDQDLESKVDFDAWLKNPGMPPVDPGHDQTLLQPVKDLMVQWTSETEPTVPWTSLNVHQKGKTRHIFHLYIYLVMFLELLDQQTKGELAHETIAKIESEYVPSDLHNVEIALKWYLLCIHNSYSPALQLAANFATTNGPKKYCRPILREMAKMATSRDLALTTFEEHQSFYHPQCRRMIASDLY